MHLEEKKGARSRCVRFMLNSCGIRMCLFLLLVVLHSNLPCHATHVPIGYWLLWSCPWSTMYHIHSIFLWFWSHGCLLADGFLTKLFPNMRHWRVGSTVAPASQSNCVGHAIWIHLGGHGAGRAKNQKDQVTTWRAAVMRLLGYSQLEWAVTR
jgi:hypothetical protein